MRIARVIGSAVSTVKDPTLTGHKLLLVRQADEQDTLTGAVFVAVDGVGAGPDELVIVAEGSAARHSAKTEGQPVDALIMGILDSLEVGGSVTFRKS